MRTANLVSALAADLPEKEATPGRLLAVALTLGAVGALILFALVLRPRHDWEAALHQVRFVLKFVVAGAFLAASVPVVLQMSRPAARAGTWVLLLPLALLGAVVAWELSATPVDQWWRRLVGSNAVFCLASIPLLAAPSLAALLIALRRSAPTRPGPAGAVAGLAAGALGALFYAVHCTDDSPLFLAAWYSLAVLVVAGAGALIGRHALRW